MKTIVSITRVFPFFIFAAWWLMVVIPQIWLENNVSNLPLY